ncbi:MAG: choice-of-anchor D domain-containing protein, partial [Thiotrichaceae bacterium]
DNLYTTDGTAANTIEVKDIYPATAGSKPSLLTESGGALIFKANDGVNGYELLISDGSTAGTTLLKDIRLGPNSSHPTLLTDIDGVVFFKAYSGGGSTELRKTDGTEVGTVQVKPIDSPRNIEDFANIDGDLYFWAREANGDPTTGFELWKSDGTATNTKMLLDINTTSSTANGNSFCPTNNIAEEVNGIAYFCANDGITGAELWKSDGTAGGTSLVADIHSTDHSKPDKLTNVNGVLFFTARDGIANGTNLWKYDGTNATLVKDIPSSSGPKELISFNNSLYFVSNSLWKSDGTEVSTVIVNNPAHLSTVSQLTVVGNKLFFRATSFGNGSELWVTDGTDVGTVMVKNIRAAGGSSNPDLLTAVDNNLFFVAHDGVSIEIWKSDGTENGTVKITSSSDLFLEDFAALTNVNNQLYFVATSRAHEEEIWKVVDSDADGTIDTVEAVVPDASGAGVGDGNGDGIADSSQSHVTSLRDVGGDDWLTYTNNSINGAQSAFEVASPPITTPADHTLIQGTAQFDITVIIMGETIDIEVYVPQNTAIVDYMLLGNDGVWDKMLASVTHVDNKTKLEFTVTEGDEYDRDATADGILQLAQGGVMVKTGMDVTPHAYRFGASALNAPTANKTVTVKNTGSRSIAISSITLGGNTPNQFNIDSETCTSGALAVAAECTIEVNMQPSSLGSKSALLQIATNDPDNALVNVFLNNYEALEQAAERRLPPVLDSLSFTPALVNNTMVAGTTYTVSWTTLGYHDDYESLIAFFNCAGIVGNNCGNSFSSNPESSGLLNPTLVETSIWHYKDEFAKVFHFSYSFTPDPAVFTTSTEVVIRFYRRNNNDKFVGNSSLSLIIPGNHSDNYYDDEGRRISVTIEP